MPYSAYDTVVRCASGKVELRRVHEVWEWCIEPELASDCVVLSVITAGGASQSFLVALTDAQDLAEVLRRKTGSPAPVTQCPS